MKANDLLTRYPDLDLQIAKDWIISRKGAPITESVLKGIEREAKACGISPTEAITICAENAWRGFRKAYYDGLMRKIEKPDYEWLKSPQGIDKKARELGIDIQKCKTYDDAKELIFKALRK